MKTLGRISFLLAVLALLTPAQAWAQGKGDVEVFFGVNYFSPKFDGLEGVADDSSPSMWGIHGDITFYFSDTIGIVLDGSFPRTDLDLNIPVGPSPASDTVSATVDYSQATYLAGPRFRFNAGGALSPSIQALIGWSSGSVGRTTIEGIEVPVLVQLSESSFAFGAGANLDLRLGQSFALRLLQASVIITNLGDTSQTTPRLSFGVVGRF